MQSSSLEAPDWEYLPAAQEMQLFRSKEEYVPASQGSQYPAFASLKYPALHFMQPSLVAAPETEYLPDSQSKQSLSVSSKYLPVLQLSQLYAPTRL
jgi:hypothetical protein